MQENEEGLSSAIFELLNDRRKASARADRSYKRIISEFTLIHVAQEYESMAGVPQTSSIVNEHRS